MSAKDIPAGQWKQVKGKANDVIGAVTGNTSRQMKGKAQKAVGKVQEAYGKATTKNRAAKEVDDLDVPAEE